MTATLRTVRMRDAVAAETSLVIRIVREAGAFYGGDPDGAQVDSAVTTGNRTLIRVAIVRGQVAGYYGLRLGPGASDLDFLFVHHQFRHQDVSRQMFADLDDQVRQRGLATVRIVAHPPAEQFLLHMGARRIGTAPPCRGVPWHRPVLAYAP